MTEVTAWIADLEDTELQKAWATLRAKVRSATGWQYRGSTLVGGEWSHCFRNRSKLEKAETEDEAEDAHQEVAASFGWLPEPAAN